MIALLAPAATIRAYLVKLANGWLITPDDTTAYLAAVGRNTLRELGEGDPR